MVAVAAGVFIAAYYTLTAQALDGFQLHNDLGIQYYLARITAEGAIPLIDFEHGWNTASWYVSAVLYRLADGNATAWVFLWGRGGFILAGVAMLVVAWRVRLPPAWIAGLTGVWIVLTHVPHNKYAVPTVWAAILLPVGGRRSLGWDRALRVGAAATVFWAHVELAVLLAVGTAMYDLVGARRGSVAQRVVTAAHAPLGVVVGLVSQIGVYWVLGLSPGDFVSQAIGNWTVTDFGPLFDYPVLAPFSIRMALFPAMMLVPFVPLLWRQLSDPTRFLAMCNLALGLIAIRRPGDGHVAAAGTLMALVLVLGAWNLTGGREDLRASFRGVRTTDWRVLLATVGGVVWYVLGLVAGFEVSSLLAIVAVTMVALSGVVAEKITDLPAASLGALVMAGLIALGGVGNHLWQTVTADEALQETALIADAVRAEVDRCADGNRDVWVVPSPLTLYDELQLTNPTPFYAFWYNLEGERDRIITLMDEGSIPMIMQVGSWPQSMTSLREPIQQRFSVCAEPRVEQTGRVITLWTYDG